MDVFVWDRSAGARGEADHPGGHVNGREEVKEVQEVEEVKEVKEKDGGVAAFFDLDGTLISLPSQEIRFFSLLRYRRVVGIRNYLAWIAESLRLIPRGINQILYANKMYLRGVRADSGTDIPVCLFPGEKAGETGKSRRQARMPVPLFPEAMERVVWHAERGHLLVIVSGTLENLAERTARAMENELEAHGLKGEIRVCATRLGAKNGTWTGRIVGEAMFGETKARAIRRIADEENLDLQRCFAYGDSAHDKWMLEIVGKPAAVNPSNDLMRIARRNDWAVLRWGKEKIFTQRPQSAQRSQRTEQSEHELQVTRAKAGFRA
jgi:HAD superfamily hydrolase (TIGR01490 family)